jgi:hypothetical protein
MTWYSGCGVSFHSDAHPTGMLFNGASVAVTSKLESSALCGRGRVEQSLNYVMFSRRMAGMMP